VQSKLGHIQFNVRAENMAFYKGLLTFAGWQVLYEAEGMLGVGGTHGESLWFAGAVKDVANDYDGPGMNHLALGVDSQADVDAAAAYLAEQSVPLLFDTPRHRPEFVGNAEQTYYQVMFESPDRLLFEIVYIGPLAG
jgi:catechol 2,3-dioxygenase-like lactoylglutathione lyase family enzyme